MIPEERNVKNPSGKAIIWLAIDPTSENKIVGQYVVIPIRVLLRGEEKMGSLSLNTLTHPKYRRMGIFTTLANLTYKKCKNENIVLTYGFPNQNSYSGFIKKLGFTLKTEAKIFLHPVDHYSLINEKINTILNKPNRVIYSSL